METDVPTTRGTPARPAHEHAILMHGARLCFDVIVSKAEALYDDWNKWLTTPKRRFHVSDEVTERRINDTSNQDTEKLLVHVCYGLYAVGILVFFTSVIAVVINYIKKNGPPEIRSHHTWMIKTFWVSLVLFLLIMVLAFIPIVNIAAIPILIIAFVWYVYRIAKGWIFFLQNKSI